MDGFAFDPDDGALIRISPPGCPEVSALLGDTEQTWHHPPRRWGKGFAITSRGAARWHLPIKTGEHDLSYSLERAGVTLRVTRELDPAGLEEHYTLTNVTDCEIRVGSVGVSVPIRDCYPSAAECLRGAFHAHVWTGGANSWVWATPMNGGGPGLGLNLREGELWAYSLENRDHFISSNIRGHLYLHPTDHSRNPEAFGGQPEIRLASGESLRWRWYLAWYEDFAAFREHRKERDFCPATLVARVGARLEVNVSSCRALGADHVRVIPQSSGKVELESSESGIRWIEIGSEPSRSRAAVLFHRSVEEIVRRRVAYILAHQQARAGEPTRAGAFLCFDRITGLTEITGAWGDWSDGRERLAMPILTQEALRRGWADAGAAEAIGLFRNYAAEFLVTSDHEVLGGGFERSTKRLYNYPWMSEFFRNEYRRTGCVEDLHMSADILGAYYKKGGRKFLGFLHGVEDLMEVLTACGEDRRAAELRENVIAQAREFREMRENLPNHEVNYEQSIVAPLALLLITAQKLLPGEDWSVSIRQVLAWLGAFEGEQPDARLAGIPIRHWDGFWFGRNRQWGDVFPHYWSVLSAAAYLEAAPLYSDLKGGLEARAGRIFRANLVHFQDDGFASCAFVYPSCVNGQPAHQFDPLANDQDWALVWLLRYAERLPWTTP